MCGFAGVIAWDEKYRIDRATLERMSAAIAHRGPDGEGIYLHDQHEITPESPLVGLAFRRLAIIDLDERSNQPFVSTDKRYVMVFNGEIYNYRELRAEISKHLPDYQWRTAGDTETLLMSYVLWKEKCVEHLNGMFAIAIWDHQEKSLYLARDRMGQKPLYVALIDIDGRTFSARREDAYWEKDRPDPTPQAIFFGSEIPSLLTTNRLPQHYEIDPTEYLQFGFNSGPNTFYHAIEKLLPAQYLSVRSQAARQRIYWTIEPESIPCVSDVDARLQTRALVQRAVARQLVADVPIGCFLSGGVDSSVVALCMIRAASSASMVNTFSIRFADPRYDESPYAQAVADHLGTTHHCFDVRPSVIDDLPKLARAFGEPFGDSSALPVHYLSRATRSHVKVALGGDGGDELFAGYERYQAMRFAHIIHRITGRHIWALASPLARLLPQRDQKSKMRQLRRFVEALRMNPSRRYSSFLRLFDGETIAALQEPMISRPIGNKNRTYGPTHNDAVYFWFGLPYFGFSGYDKDRIRDPIRAAMVFDRLVYLPDDLLQKVDRCSMLHGLEVRSPFMDHELVQFAAGLTTDQLLKGGKKRMLREAFAKDLPDFVFKRKKMGFAVPIGEWFRGELRSMLRDHLFASDGFCRAHFNMKVVERLVEEHEQERVDHSQRLYALLMLEMWWVHVARASRT